MAQKSLIALLVICSSMIVGAQERGAVVTRERLMDEVWDENWFGSTKTLDATVGRLRQKLEAAGSPVAVGTVRGVGFRLEDA